jgi:hypothetical protein
MVIKKIIFPVCICTCLKIVGYLMIEGTVKTLSSGRSHFGFLKFIRNMHFAEDHSGNAPANLLSNG